MTDDTIQTTWGEPDDSTGNDDTAANATELGSLPARRSMPLGESFQGERDLYDTLGYDESLAVEDYWNRYLRQDIARSIVDAPAKTTWRERPEITDDDSDDSMTPFEKGVERLFREHELQSRLDAIDRLAGIGRFGLLVVGVADGSDLSQPVESGALSGPDDLAYLMPIAEDRVDEWELVEDETDERFNLPESYRIDFSSQPRDELGRSFHSAENIREVHHSRVVHVPAGNTLDNLLMGRPRLEAVYNRLQDLEKVVGSSAEMMWRAADYGLALKSDPEVAGKLGQTEMENLEDELQKWYHDLQPFLRVAGFDIERLGGENPEPEGVFDALIKLIAGETGIPQRVLTGSERGELASTQDRASWLGRISERQSNFAEPKILRPLLDTLVDFGILPEPSGGGGDDLTAYEVEWPNLFVLSETEQAEVASKLASALKASRNPNSAEAVMTPQEVRDVIFGIDPEVGAEVDVDPSEGEQDDPLADLLPDGERGDGPPDDADEPVDEDDDAVEQQFDLSATSTPGVLSTDGGDDAS